MNRRDFIKAASGGALLLGAAPSVSHAAAENRPPIPGSLGMLYDSTLCVGCQACVTKCQDINFPARNPEGEQTWSNNDKLSPYTNNIIQVWRSGTGVNKDQEENGYAYIKKQCMHCVDPNCVSVCPVSALKKIRKPASSTMTKMSAPAAVTVWSPVRTTYLSTTTTTRLARFTNVSCVTRKALSVWIKAVCLGVWKFVRQGPSFSVLVKS